jgi:hypothetical protein
MTRPVTQYRSADLMRRYNVIALGLVLCAWLITAVAHLHVREQGADKPDSAHCTYCFAFASGVAPTPELRLPARIDASIGRVACDDTPVEDRAIPSFYFSRGPPSA